MFEINRSSIVVKPRQPFLDWARSHDEDNEDLTLDNVRDDPTVYLIPDLWDNTEPNLVLEWCHSLVFDVELASWHTDPEAWPPDRDLRMFLEWFEVEFHSMCYDLCDDPIEPGDDDVPAGLGPATWH